MNARSFLVCGLMLLVALQTYGKGGTNQVFFAAAEAGDVPRLKRLFATNVVEPPLRNGLLRVAAATGQTEVVEFLVSQGADVNEKGFFRLEPLASMAMFGTTNDEKCAAVAAVLLAHGAEVDPVDDYGATPLYHAVEWNKIKLARLLLEHGANAGRPWKGTYRTPLLIAVRDRHLDMVKLLLDFKAPPDITDPDGNMPLLAWAIQRRNRELARLLIEHGAKLAPSRTKPDFVDWKMNRYSDDFATPLLAAIRARDSEMVALLLRSNAPANEIDRNGQTPLHWAVRFGDTNIVKLLLDAKARVDVPDHSGFTPVTLADMAESKPIIQMLRQAAIAQGVTMPGVAAPSGDDMRAIAQRICQGDPAALDDLAAAARQLYSGDWRQPPRRLLNGLRMDAAFKVLGEAAASGNSHALLALRKCLDRDDFLRDFAPGGLGIAAAAGSDESLKLLLRYRHWHVPEASAAFALAPAAKANKQPAVDFFVNLALAPDSVKHDYYGVRWLVKGVLQTCVTNGNSNAKDALDKILAAPGM